MGVDPILDETQVYYTKVLGVNRVCTNSEAIQCALLTRITAHARLANTKRQLARNFAVTAVISRM